MPLSNSNSFRNPSARSNHFALFFGSRTARPKWPTSPTVNGTFIWIALLRLEAVFELTFVLAGIEMAFRFGDEAVIADPPRLVAPDPDAITCSCIRAR